MLDARSRSLSASGRGIVADSDPAAEFQESMNKAKAVFTSSRTSEKQRVTNRTAASCRLSRARPALGRQFPPIIRSFENGFNPGDRNPRPNGKASRLMRMRAAARLPAAPGHRGVMSPASGSLACELCAEAPRHQRRRIPLPHTLRNVATPAPLHTKTGSRHRAPLFPASIRKRSCFAVWRRAIRQFVAHRSAVPTIHPGSGLAPFSFSLGVSKIFSI